MRVVLGIAFLALGAGCLEPTTSPTTGPGPATLNGWRLDCTLGSYEAGPWVHPCVARASHTPGPKQEIWLAVNPKDPLNVVLSSKDNNPESSNDCTWNGLAVTHDGGRAWKDVTIGGRYADRRPGDMYHGYACNTDPMFAFAADGTLHYVVELYNFGGQGADGPLSDPVTGADVFNPGWKLVLATSYDGGLTWPLHTVLLHGDGAAALNDYSRILVSPTTGTILVAINTFQGVFSVGPAPVPSYHACSVIASRDGGRTADPPVEVTDRDRPGQFYCYGAAVAPDGTFALGSGGTFGGGNTYFARSADDGRSFTDPEPGFTFQRVPHQFNNTKARNGQNFELLYDQTSGARRGTLYAAYADYPGGQADVQIRASPDHGRTWGPARPMTDAPNAHHQWLPNALVAADGSLHAVFFDRRWDAANRYTDVTHAVSVDGGETWLNERVTEASFDTDLGVHQGKFPFIGDYLGIGAVGDEVWLGFPDTSTGTSVIAAARSFRLEASSP